MKINISLDWKYDFFYLLPLIEQDLEDNDSQDFSVSFSFSITGSNCVASSTFLKDDIVFVLSSYFWEVKFT